MFWNLTPWQTAIAIEAYSEKREGEHIEARWMAWHTAALQRVKTLDQMHLKKFLNTKAEKPVKGIDEAAIISRLKAYNRGAEKHGAGSKTKC